jgi:hypothetical protein
MLKIDKKIIGYKVVDKIEEPVAEAQLMHELLPRPNCLTGTTYKVKTPQSEHALYITINDMVLDGIHHPYEMFINSKNMDHFQWVLALTRVVSAVFRKGGDCTFLVEELKAVFDPKGGYFKKGGRFMPSLVAEIGDCIEKHLIDIGMLRTEELEDHQRKLIDEKRAQIESSSARSAAREEKDGYPPGAQLCSKCMTKATVMMDGCMTCLSCGDSKCG